MDATGSTPPPLRDHGEDSGDGRPEEVDVLVAGAGPTGLMLALWLVRLGVRVQVVDPKPAVAPESRAIIVHARTLEFYDQLGLHEAVADQGRRVEALEVWRRRRRCARVRLGRVATGLSPHPYLTILAQDANERLLLAQLEALGGAVAWGTELTGFDQDAGGVTALVRRGGRTTTVRAAYLAGADGSHSQVRRAAGIGFTGARYAQDFFVADVTARGGLFGQDAALRFDQDRFVLVIPMPGQDHYRVVGQVEATAAAEPAGPGPAEAASRAQVEAATGGGVDTVHWHSTYAVHHRVAERFADRRVFLLGDAGHVHSPVGGQGMNTGLGDAANLAWKLAQALAGPPAAARELLATYPAERRPFALTLVATTDRAFTAVTSPSPAVRVLRDAVLTCVLPLVARRRATARTAFRFVSQIRIAYPASALSAGRAGRVRGGDRLPWVPGQHGSSNYDLLAAPGWQVHVYGSPPPWLPAWADRRGVALHVLAHSPAARRAGIARDAVHLVRPDGHVGLVTASPTPAALARYADRWLPAPPAASGPARGAAPTRPADDRVVRSG